MKTTYLKYLSAISLAVILAGCTSVHVTKTAKGLFNPTNPDEVEILQTRPDRDFIELASISAAKISPEKTAKMHNALREKSAPFGADAVIILNSGMNDDGELWVTGVAIKYKE